MEDREKIMESFKADEESRAEGSSVKVENEVYAIIAGLALDGIDEVVETSGGFGDGFNKLLGKDNPAKGIKVTSQGKNVEIDVNVVLAYGSVIPDVAVAIQKKVKEDVERMGDCKVTAVNVFVQGIRRGKDKDLREVKDIKEVKDLNEVKDDGNT